MSQKHENLFTIGEFAEKSGVTLRTLRYYDKIGLLKPNTHNQVGHRLYSREDFGRLQKILTLKFIGLSLENIMDIMKQDVNDSDLKKSLEIQKEITNEKIQHINSVVKAIEEAVHMLDNEKVLNWDKFLNIINVINTDKKWLDQYENASNLKARIKIHETFSTNKEGWMNWFFKQLSFPYKVRILELGCGDGSLWQKNLSHVPAAWDITLTDFSPGMLEDAKRNLNPHEDRFKFQIADAENIPFPDESFEVVIANNMLYHLTDKDKAFSEINRVLTSSGYFYASTVGKNHMKEMRELVASFNSPNITTESWDTTESFQLENGLSEVSKWFKEVKLKRYEDSLIVTDGVLLADYIFSMPGNSKLALKSNEINGFVSFLNSIIQKNNGIYITKDTGFFVGRK